MRNKSPGLASFAVRVRAKAWRCCATRASSRYRLAQIEEIDLNEGFCHWFLGFGSTLCRGKGRSRRRSTTLDISYTGSNLGVSGTGVVQAISAGNGEYDLVSGYINAVLPGVGTVHETLVTNPNAPNFSTTAVFENANGDEFTYDDRVFSPFNSPASTDGAQLTYAGGLVFQTAAPSKEDVYLSANNHGSFGGYFYFGGYDRPYGTLGDGSLSNLSITVASVPEPSSLLTASTAVILHGTFGLFRRRKTASA